MIWAVAARFPGEGSAWKMPLSVLRFWYAGHRTICKELGYL